jgi:hypothetical protein
MNDGTGITASDLKETHPRLDESSALTHRPAPDEE